MLANELRVGVLLNTEDVYRKVVSVDDEVATLNVVCVRHTELAFASNKVTLCSDTSDTGEIWIENMTDKGDIFLICHSYANGNLDHLRNKFARSALSKAQKTRFCL